MSSALVKSHGSGVPSHTAARGTFYYRDNGELYINTDGATTWAQVNGAAAASEVYAQIFMTMGA
jgi:hypothetical protein